MPDQVSDLTGRETYYGDVCTSEDAIKLFEACRLGRLKQLHGRLSGDELVKIRSGSVFVWDDAKAHIRRWADKKEWCAGRKIQGFRTYRELECQSGVPQYKPDGLIKRSFNRTCLTGQRFRLISYRAAALPDEPGLIHPTADMSLTDIHPDKTRYHKYLTVPSRRCMKKILPAQNRAREPATRQYIVEEAEEAETEKTEETSRDKPAHQEGLNEDDEPQFFLDASRAIEDAVTPTNLSAVEKPLSFGWDTEEISYAGTQCSQLVDTEEYLGPQLDFIYSTDNAATSSQGISYSPKMQSFIS